MNGVIYSSDYPPQMKPAASKRAYAALHKVARKLGVRLVVRSALHTRKQRDALFDEFDLFDLCESPVSCVVGVAGVLFRLKMVYIESASTSPATVLHEMVHLALGPCSLRLDERYVLLSYEWQLAKHISTWLPKPDRASFLAAVDFLQDADPDFQDPADVPVGNARKSSWWHNGLERAQALGLLNSRRAPTFKCAQWKRSGVSTRLRRWSPKLDHMYPVRSA